LRQAIVERDIQAVGARRSKSAASRYFTFASAAPAWDRLTAQGGASTTLLPARLDQV
jgi:hypothetical protein